METSMLRLPEPTKSFLTKCLYVVDVAWTCSSAKATALILLKFSQKRFYAIHLTNTRTVILNNL